jgi:hypothetical protein
MGIPEGRVRPMDGSHRGKVYRITVPIIFNGTRLNIFNFEKYFLTFGLTKTNLVSNSLTVRARQF